MDDRILEEFIQKVLIEIKNNQPEIHPSYDVSKLNGGNKLGIFSSVDQAVIAARQGFMSLNASTLEKRKEIVMAMREQGKLYARELAQQARDETGFGDVESKVAKNILVCNKTPGPEIIQPVAFSGDHGLTVIERAPFGVVGSITPSTNPTSTLINNAISIISAGNAVVYNVHPRAKNVSVRTIQLLNQAIQAVGGPANIITTIDPPTVEGAQQLMRHSGVDLMVVTGGPAVVKVAMQSGKRAICAGPGNPPAVVDETADIDKTAQDLVLGSSFDNNLPCTCEKEVFVVESVADQLIKSMQNNGAVELTRDKIQILENVIFKEKGQPWDHAVMNPSLIGQSASDILNAAGLPVEKNVKLIILQVPPEHPLVYTEQMMPVLPIVRVRNYSEAVDFALKAEQGFHHCAGIHSLDIRNLSHMAKVMNTSLFIKNGPHYAGLGYQSEGYTSFSIGTFTREGLTTAKSFTWERRCVLVDHFRIV